MSMILIKGSLYTLRFWEMRFSALLHYNLLRSKLSYSRLDCLLCKYDIEVSFTTIVQVYPHNCNSEHEMFWIKMNLSLYWLGKVVRFKRPIDNLPWYGLDAKISEEYGKYDKYHYRKKSSCCCFKLRFSLVA